jgi:hypothetical protein
MSLALYSKVMLGYFGTYAVTMVTNPDLFWSASGIAPLKFVGSVGSATTLSGFFARMTGFGFLALVFGKLAGASDKVFAKQCNLFHIGTLYWFYQLSQYVPGKKEIPAAFNSATWQIQCVVSIIFAAWGIHALGGIKKAIKLD